MKKLLKTIIDDMDFYVAMVIGAGTILFTCWIIYKICAGVYHLLDKLIDKL